MISKPEQGNIRKENQAHLNYEHRSTNHKSEIRMTPARLKESNSSYLLSTSCVPFSGLLSHVILPIFYDGRTIVILIL